jgi:hypothetical protein
MSFKEAWELLMDDCQPMDKEALVDLPDKVMTAKIERKRKSKGYDQQGQIGEEAVQKSSQEISQE